MKKIRIIAYSVSALIFTNATLFIVNILQAGRRYPDGRTVEEILGMRAEDAQYEDVEALNRRDTMQLFYAAKAPDFKRMKGEYCGRVLSGGVLGKSTEIFTNHVFPSGRFTPNSKWEGKAFMPVEESEGWGINVFNIKKRGTAQTIRKRKMRTYLGPTRIGKDGSDSMHLDYAPFNTGINGTMHDEIRMINDDLFICAGFISAFGGPLNPGPFTLLGPPVEWVDPD